MNGLQKIVVSSTLEDPAWSPTTVIRGDVARELGAMKDGPGGDILVAGSGHLVRTMLADGLVDELRLMVFPIVLGTGNRLFSDGTPRTSLRLVEARPVGPAGVVVRTYAAPTGPRRMGCRHPDRHSTASMTSVDLTSTVTFVPFAS